MLVVFEGIDGSGKTAVAKAVLERLRARGVDLKSLVLGEGLLGAPEVLGYTSETFGLPSNAVPDLVVLVNSDPVLARARRITAEISNAQNLWGTPTRLALSLQYRLRGGYLQLARAEPDRWAVVDNGLLLEATVSKVCRLIEDSLAHGAPESLAAFRAASVRFPHLVKPVVRSASMALAEVLAWIKQRSHHEPAVAAYWLAGWCGLRVDELRWSLSPRAPKVMLESIRGLADDTSFRIRDRLALQHPRAAALSLKGLSGARAAGARAELARVASDAVAISLEGCDDCESWALRECLAEVCPDRVMESLAGLSSDHAWELRERWFSRNRAHFRDHEELHAVAARSVKSLVGERAWLVRAAARSAAPLALLRSITGLTDDASWELRGDMIKRAPELVLETIAGVSDERAWRLRASVAAACKQALDGMIGLSADGAWDLREEYRDLWPSTVVKSLGALAFEARGAALLERQLRAHGNDAGVLRHAAAFALSPLALDPHRAHGLHRESNFPGERKVTRL